MDHFPFLDGDVSRFTSYGVYISQLVMGLTSMHVVKFELLNFSIGTIGIINFERPFQNFIIDTMNWFQNSRSD